MMQTYWTNPPAPFLPGSERAPVPGWGVSPAVAGPYRVGVGQIDPSAFRQRYPAAPVYDEALPPPDVEEATEGIPWWYYAAGAVTIVAGAAVAYNMGWIG